MTRSCTLPRLRQRAGDNKLARRAALLDGLGLPDCDRPITSSLDSDNESQEKLASRLQVSLVKVESIGIVIW